MEIPTNLRELQCLVGKLMYASPHIPHFKERIKPIEALLSGKGRVSWTAACTAALNDLVRCIYARVRLVPADPYGRLVMYPSKRDGLGFVACLQGGAPVAFVLRALSRTEMKLGILSRLIAVVAWAVRRLRRYTTFAEEILVVLPDAESVVVALDTATHLRLRAHIVEL